LPFGECHVRLRFKRFSTGTLGEKKANVKLFFFSRYLHFIAVAFQNWRSIGALLFRLRCFLNFYYGELLRLSLAFMNGYGHAFAIVWFELF